MRGLTAWAELHWQGSKSAEIPGGDTMGDFIAGDAAIPTRWRELAQDFNVHTRWWTANNFGNIDGDNPAASPHPRRG
ncbi:MAG: hypothetical protein R3D59_17210 [Paracoccaceae bacterium]